MYDLNYAFPVLKIAGIFLRTILNKSVILTIMGKSLHLSDVSNKGQGKITGSSIREDQILLNCV